MILRLSLFFILLSYGLRSQNTLDPHLAWTENNEKEKTEYACRLYVDSKGQLNKIYIHPEGVYLSRVTKDNKLIDSKRFIDRDVLTEGFSGEFTQFQVGDNIYFITKHKNKELETFEVKLSKIDIAEMAIKFTGKLLFKQAFLKNADAEKIHVAVSPNKSKFFIGYHDLIEKVKKEYRFSFHGLVFDHSENQIHESTYNFTSPNEFVDQQFSQAQITNSGAMFLNHFKGSQLLYSSFNTNSYQIINLSQLVDDENVKSINNITQLTNQEREVFSFSFSDQKDPRFFSGIVLAEIRNGEVEVLNQIEIPKEYLDLMANTEYVETENCIGNDDKGKPVLNNWFISDFLKVGSYYYLITEYNSVIWRFQGLGSADVSRNGEMIVYRLDRDFSELKSFLIPKAFGSEGTLGHCHFILSKASRKSYTLVVKNSKLVLFYWGNKKNEILQNKNRDTERTVYHVPTSHRENQCLYKLTIDNSLNRPVYKNLGSYKEMENGLLANTGVVINGQIFFACAYRRLPNTDSFKLATYTFQK